jgi:hypothetical protein
MRTRVAPRNAGVEVPVDVEDPPGTAGGVIPPPEEESVRAFFVKARRDGRAAPEEMERALAEYGPREALSYGYR